MFIACSRAADADALRQSTLHHGRALALLLHLPMSERELDSCRLDPSVEHLANDIDSNRCAPIRKLTRYSMTAMMQCHNHSQDQTPA